MHLALETTCRDTWHMDETTPGGRARALRLRLKLSQDLADRGGPDRTVMSKIESGAKKLQGVESRGKLARAFGLSLGDFDAYLSGQLSLDDLMESRVEREARDTPEPEVPSFVGTSAAGFDRAIATAFRQGSYELADLDAVRALLRSGAAQIADLPHLDEAARAWLRGAARLRRMGRPVTVATLTWASTAKDDEMNAEATAALAAIGGAPPATPVRTPPRGTPSVRPPEPVPMKK